MGCDYTFSCSDCKKSYYLGYGSYSTWIGALTLDKFEEDAIKIEQNRGLDPRKLKKNMDLRQCIVRHNGHETALWSRDWAWPEGDDILMDGRMAPDVLVSGGAHFDLVDLDTDVVEHLAHLGPLDEDAY